ncbi:unnamed protein product [Arctia plantaginis]|uniref:Uncharacterized protein n=1 Tax=Arctia plantaginis TaxID=874455 RepID=A0A8S1B4E9_ARCPL|nr:unnamed protein product [Arctia plantaginis]
MRQEPPCSPCLNMFCKIIIASVGAVLVAVLSTADTDAEASLHRALLQNKAIILKDERRRTPIILKALDGRVRDKGGVTRRGRSRSRDRSDHEKRGHLHRFRSRGFDRKPHRSGAQKDSRHGHWMSGHHSHGKSDHHRHGEPGHPIRRKPSCHKKHRRPKPPQLHDQARPHGGEPGKSKLPGQSMVPLAGFSYYWGDDAGTDKGRDTGHYNDRDRNVYGNSEVSYDWTSWSYPL